MAILTGTEEALQAMRILENWREGADDPFRAAGGRRRTTLEEEQGEVLEGVLEFLAAGGTNQDRTAACDHLLRHLSSVRARRGPVWVS